MSGASNTALLNKPSCERYKKHLKVYHANADKKPRRLIVSKSPKSSENNEKSYSTSKIKKNSKTAKNEAKPKKTTHSDLTVQKNMAKTSPLDCCKVCGDTKTCLGAIAFDKFSNTSTQIQKSRTVVKDENNIEDKLDTNEAAKQEAKNGDSIKTILKTSSPHSTTNQQERKSNAETKTRIVNRKERTVQQYYKNENFLQTSDSHHELERTAIKIPPLDTIKESSHSGRTTTNYPTQTESSNKLSETSEDDLKTLDDIKQFRDKNYFECHSSSTRIKSNACGPISSNHKCVYRFYLNDRLFPVPLCTDHKNNIRCVECHLPLKEKGEDRYLNGTIQAKVKFNDDDEKPSDLTLFLPVKESLIIKEKRPEKKLPNDDEVMYFGVVKLGADGNSVFKSVKPADSLALRHQKGYREYRSMADLNYDPVTPDDIIVI